MPQSTQLLFRTALEIPFTYHLKHQQMFQQYTDNAVSKTINLPHETEAATISNIYQMAWKLGLKGITIYRDRSKSQQVLSVAKPHESWNRVDDASCRVCVN